jgi:predicted TIM-barrel fold metal-dependent hydrolase
MSATTRSAVEAAIDRARAEALWDGPVIDCDVHAQVVSMRETLFPYIAPTWQEFVVERGYLAPPGIATVYPPNAPSTTAAEWRREGAAAGSHLNVVRSDVLDAWPAERAVLNCYWAIDSCRHPDVAAVLAAAVNDWIVAEWLDRDPRLRASLVVPSHSVPDAVKEIERVGGHPGFVQVLAPVRASHPYGNRSWWPLMQAMVEHDLVLGLHWGGSSDGAPTACGWPSWYAEEYAGEQQVFMAQLLSLIAEGTLQRFPSLRVAVLEAGFAWAPSLLWRLDKEWKGLRRSVPWMNEAPSAMIRRHVRFAVSPIDPGPLHQMEQIIEWLGPGMLMFSSDYPHHHSDDIATLLRAVAADERAGVMAETARSWYRLP